jgi:proteic killer suppression protein
LFTNLVNNLEFNPPVDIEILDDDLRKTCEQERSATKAYGRPCARKLRARLADLIAAMNVQELVAGRPHPLKGDRSGQFSLDLQGGVRLVFEPANDPIPKRDDGGIDWRSVTRVRIVFIGDYHD